MTLGQWCNKYRGLNLALNDLGEIVYSKCPTEWQKIDDKMREDFYRELAEFKLIEKTEKITAAQLALKNAGIDCTLRNFDNGHITAKSRHGRTRS